MRLFVAHFVLCEENLWFTDEFQSTVLRRSRTHYLSAQLFSADDAKAAYERVIGLVDGFSDANHDGPGDLTTYECIGVHELEDVTPAGETLEVALSTNYGIDVGQIALGEDAPPIASKSDLLLMAQGEYWKPSSRR
ncbi:hypothetical protein [Lysobacter gummosus]|uniref:Uncharacterized protein n=1 Tax=Lysobacter gummosus TaxID=262324 RepID=A0ABY3X7Q5_9GAMM|nr:hypothetical protein [Lysobacter gummosus]UNP27491.1 hypothetical protein MOV92_13215 [Lysobacter gummosus]